MSARAALDGRLGGPLPPRHKLALRYAEALAWQTEPVDREFYSVLLSEFTAAQVVELGTLVALCVGFIGSLIPTWSLEEESE